MTGAPSRAETLRGYGLVLIAAVCWTTGGLTADWLFTAPGPATASWLVPPLGISIDPAALSASRALASAVVLAVWLAMTRRHDVRVGLRDAPFLAVFGVVGLALMHLAYFKTIQISGDPAAAILLEYLAPVIVLGVSVAFLGHRFGWRLPVGAVVAVAGCALVAGVAGPGELSLPLAAVAWGLASAVFFAVYSLMGAAGTRRYGPYRLMLWGLAAAAAFWFVAIGPTRVLEPFTSPGTALAVLWIAVVSTVVPFGAFLAALRVVRPAAAIITSTIEPVLAAAGAYVLFGRVPTTTQAIGGALVLIAIALAQSDPSSTPVAPAGP